jgi:rhodanese-related sulfurtransferase
MKKILAVLSILIILGLAACGGGADEQTTTEIDRDSLPASVDVDTVRTLQDNPDVFMLDVREPDEYAAGHIPGIVLIPMGEVAERLSEIPEDKTVIVTCRSGNRSGQIADLLREMGYADVHNMEGGIVAWEEAGYPIE